MSSPVQQLAKLAINGSQSAPIKTDHHQASFYGEKFATVPPRGTAGIPVQARVNYFELEPLPSTIYMYSLAFVPSRGGELKNSALKKQVVVRILEHSFLKDHVSKIATDYSSWLISGKDLEAESPFQFRSARSGPREAQVTVTFTPDGRDREETFTVEISRIHTITKQKLNAFLDGDDFFDCSTWMNALNIMAQKHALIQSPSPKYVKAGKFNIYPMLASGRNFDCGLHPRSGFYSSIRPVTGKLVMNLHNVSAAFINPQALLDYVRQYFKDFRPESWQSEPQARSHDGRFKSLTRGVRVRLTYKPITAENKERSIISNPVQNGLLGRINGHGESAATQKFKHSTHGPITVEDYFNKYVLPAGMKLKYPQTLVANLGSNAQPCWVPTELLHIEPDQKFSAQLPEKAMADMIKIAQHKPAENVDIIEKAFALRGMYDAQRLQINGIAMKRGTQGPKMLTAEGRMLKTPELVYAAGSEKGLREGGTVRESGRWDLRNKKFKEGGELAVLGVIEIGNTGKGLPTYKKFADELKKYGVKGSREVVVMKAKSASKSALNSAINVLKEKKANPVKTVLLVLLEDQLNDEQYAAVKSWADTSLGVSTICVTAEKAHLLNNAQFIANLALKINVKMGGRNHILAKETLDLLHPGGPTMVVGADVTHPGQAAVKHCPSIAAMVASFDKSATLYPGSLRLQRSKQERIQNISDMIAERLEVFREKNGSFPANILFYRDGVSEGQFPMVKREELPEIRKGCKLAGSKHDQPDYAPKITLLVCSKRHHTRVFPAETPAKGTMWAIDANGNFNPGLVVDDPAIRSPYHFDFYLQSHKALKGTARPCHYFVIQNDMNLSADQLQAISFSLCWIFVTALTPISYAAPAYYADRLAERGRAYLRPLLTLRHPLRPTEMQLLAKMPKKTNAQGRMIQPSEEEKDRYVCEFIAGGAGDIWPGYNADPQKSRASPMRKEIEQTMFYV